MDLPDLPKYENDKYYYLEWALTFLFGIYWIFQAFNDGIVFHKGELVFDIIFGPILCIVCFILANFPAKLIVIAIQLTIDVIKIIAASFSLMIGILSWIIKLLPSSNNSKTHLRRLVRYFLAEETKNIFGDLREEFSRFQSKPKAYVWLSKQILTSIPHLLYDKLKSRLASYFGKGVR